VYLQFDDLIFLPQKAQKKMKENTKELLFL